MTAARPDRPPAPRLGSSTFKPVQEVDRSPVATHEAVSGSAKPAVVSGLVALVAFVPRLMTAGHHLTYDEIVWMLRTGRYSNALTTADLSGMTAAKGQQTATLPGVPTMIVGSIARFFYGIGQKLGVISAKPFADAWTGLQAAQIVMAVATSLLIGLLVWLTWKWLGAIPAVTAGFFLATEPLLVAHGAVLHTDELLGIFGACTVVLLARLLGRGGPPLSRPSLTAVAAGVFAGLTALTKLSAVAFLPGVALLCAWVAWRRIAAARRTGNRWLDALGSVVEPLAIINLSAAATIAVLWPALVVAPNDQLGVLRNSASLADAGQFAVFRGEITFAPSGLFYFITAPFRMTPWFLIATLIFVPLALTDRSRRRQVLSIVVVIAGFMTILTLTPKKIDRYIVAVLPLLAIVVGIGVASTVDLVGRSRFGPNAQRLVGRHRRALRLGAAAVVVATVGYSLHVSPWGGIYFNPMLGGSARAEQLLVVGWGEGIRDAADIIAAREAGNCDNIKVAMAVPYFGRAIPCGRSTSVGDKNADYRIVYINDRQLDVYGRLADFRARNAPVGVVKERGIVLAEVYDLRKPG